MSIDTPEVTGNRATRRAAGQRGRKLAAIGSGAVLATGVAAGAVASFATSAAAAPITVQNTNDSGAGSLREALANANPGDTIDLTGLSGTITLTSGELVIEDAVTISGPGPSVLAIDGNHASRVFQMNSDLSGGTVTISGITITGGDAGKGQGGGINFYCDGGAANLVIDNTVVTGNAGDDLGGGLYFDRCHNGSNLTIQNSVVSNNTARSSGGGGIWFDEGDTLTIQNSSISGNRGAYYGGGLYFDDGVNLIVLNSTLSDNHASQGTDAAGDGSGGAMQLTDITGTAQIANSTINGNTADFNGGGINLESGSLSLQQTTISGNTANVGTGDGLYLGYGASGKAAHAPRGKQAQDGDGPSAADVGTVDIAGTIVAGNADGTDDIASGSEAGVTASIASSVIGAVNNVGVTDGGGNQMGVTDPGLEALADNGGATQTMALKAGSPAIDKGPDPVPSFPGNEFDQRGAGFDRVVNGKVDVGAYEVQAPAPEPVVIAPKFTG